jgi:hypothetical protein
MVDQEHSSSQAHLTARPQAVSPLRSRLRSSVRLLLFVGVPFAMIVLILAAMLSGRQSESEVLVNEKVHTIQLDVLNGTGESKLAQRLTDFLRGRGFDVVEMGNYAGDLESTLVIDRTGHREAAIRVAQSLGVPEERVIQKIDKTLYLDVSVYIGKDYRSLDPFR